MSQSENWKCAEYWKCLMHSAFCTRCFRIHKYMCESRKDDFKASVNARLFMIGNNQSMGTLLGWWRHWRHQYTYVPHFWLMTKSKGRYVDWWCQERHRSSTALINWLLPIMRKLYKCVTALINWLLPIMRKLYKCVTALINWLLPIMRKLYKCVFF